LSSINPAYFKNNGPNPYQSHILSKRLLGSKILTGREIPIMLYPVNTLDAAFDNTSLNIPFYFSNTYALLFFPASLSFSKVLRNIFTSTKNL
jgi:hypothetical protein